MSANQSVVMPKKRRSPQSDVAEPEAGAKKTKRTAEAADEEQQQADNGPNDGSNSSSSDSDDDDDDEAIDLSAPEKVKKDDMLQIHFEFYDPREGDFHSVKQQLANKFPGVCEGSNLSDITDAVVSQAEVGLLVRVADTDHVFGVATALPAATYRKTGFWQAIEKKLVAACPAEKASAFNAALEAPGLGLLLSQRILNIPDHLVPKIYENLREDIRWASGKEGGVDEATRKLFDMKRLLLVAPYSLRHVAKDKVSNSSSGSGNGGGGSSSDTTTRAFLKAEERYLAKAADIVFDVKLTPSETSAGNNGASDGLGAAVSAIPTTFVAMVVDLEKAMEAIDDFDNDLPPLPEAE